MRNVTVEQLLHEVAAQPELLAVLRGKPEEFGARFGFSKEQGAALKSADTFRPMRPDITFETGTTIEA